MTHQSEMGIGDAELRALTNDLGTLHRETFPAALEQLQDAASPMRAAAPRAASRATSRRGILLGAMAAAGAGVLAACGSSSGGSSTSSAAATPARLSSASRYPGDLKVVALAAALENLAVAAYTTALAKAKAGDYGPVPAAVGQFAMVAMSQHGDHAKAWNGVLTAARLPAVTGTPLTIAASEVAKLKATTSVIQLARFALSLENAAAETYLYAMANVADEGGIATAASIAPVEAMHASILGFIAGQYPVPDSFLGVTSAVMPSALTA